MSSVRETLLRQFDTAWALTDYHLSGLTTAECLWRPAPVGLHVWPSADGAWHADWPEHEGYTLGPPSIAWITWHITFWWSMVLDHSFGGSQLTREAVPWPGEAAAVCDALRRLRERWLAEVSSLPECAFGETGRTQWPMRDRPFADVVAWANLELMKNASELGYVRFLHAVRGT